MVQRSIIGLAMLCISFALGGSAISDHPNRLIGTWRLVSARIERPERVPIDLYGPAPSGLLIYDTTGHMSVHLMRPGLPRFSSGGRFQATPEEAKRALDGYLGYWGRFKVDAADGTVTHFIEGSSNPNYVGTEQERSYVVSGERLTITNYGPPDKQVQAVGIFVWERVK